MHVLLTAVQLTRNSAINQKLTSFSLTAVKKYFVIC